MAAQLLVEKSSASDRTSRREVIMDEPHGPQRQEASA